MRLQDYPKASGATTAHCHRHIYTPLNGAEVPEREPIRNSFLSNPIYTHPHPCPLCTVVQTVNTLSLMSADAEKSGQLVPIGIGQAVVLLSQSFALLAYKRALAPLYSSVPASSYVSYVSIISFFLGSVVGVPTSVAALAYGSLLAAAPNTVFYVGKYTGRWRDLTLGPIVTHAIVLAPILMSGIALFQSAHSVRVRPS